MCTKQNILMCCREVNDVTAVRGFVTAVTGSVHKGSTFNPFYKLLMNVVLMRNETRQTQKEHGAHDAPCSLPQTRQGINHEFKSGCPSVITVVKLRKSRCCSTPL